LSSLKPSKNIEGIIDAYKYLLKKKRIENTKLVIAGKKAWMYDTVFEKVRELGLEDKVIFTGYVDEKDKTALLSGAKMLLSPSFWEGFGMHVIEAMACGTPVVVSDVASLPEVISDAGVYVDPESFKSIAEGIVKINDMEEKQYNRLKEKCIERSKVFDWDKTARESLKLLAKAI
jgi:glycosyltransferase involved in cell wall biosynthesis